MSRLTIGAALLPLVLMLAPAAKAGFFADRCSAESGGAPEACRCVERELTTTASPRLLSILQAIAAGRSEEARTLILDLSVTERTSFQETLVRSAADAGVRCGANWQPKLTGG